MAVDSRDVLAELDAGHDYGMRAWRRYGANGTVPPMGYAAPELSAALDDLDKFRDGVAVWAKRGVRWTDAAGGKFRGIGRAKIERVKVAADRLVAGLKPLPTATPGKIQNSPSWADMTVKPAANYLADAAPKVEFGIVIAVAAMWYIDRHRNR